MDLPTYSPDLNPIEHLWDALGRRIAARLHHPENTQQLKQKLIEEWVLLPQEMLHQLVLSMRRRKDRPGGGLAFLVKSADIKFRETTLPPTTDYDENSTEVQAITVLLSQQEATIINAYIQTTLTST
ncbi:transposable element Tcb2 transposase [Trichonephila clavipes]|nr:transposable element Tcb2 transposase [Trichonephila clavipes]